MWAYGNSKGTGNNSYGDIGTAEGEDQQTFIELHESLDTETENAFQSRDEQLHEKVKQLRVEHTTKTEKKGNSIADGIGLLGQGMKDMGSTMGKEFSKGLIEMAKIKHGRKEADPAELLFRTQVTTFQDEMLKTSKQNNEINMELLSYLKKLNN